MKRSIALLALLLWLSTVALVHAQTLPSVKPEQVGLSSERLGRLVTMLRHDSEKGQIPGAVLLVARQGKIALFESVGVLDPQSKAPMTKDAIFRIYSMSKPITSVAIMTLVEDGKIALGDPVAKYIPQIAEMQVGVEKPGADGKPTLELVPPRRQMTVQDLLRHTSGLTYGIFGNTLVKKQYLEAKLFDGDPTNAEFVTRLSKLPLASHPGTMWDYSHSTDVLGRVVEVVSNKSLYQFMKERILDPLGMKETTFDVTDKSKHARIAEPFPNDRTIGTNTDFFDPRVPQRWQSGGGGMMGTTTVGEYYWGGAGGTYFWIDPKEDLFVVFAMQAPKQRAYYRPLLKNMVYGAITKTNGK
jgi:CubicO group peptidase (beta-lactamase class C family)